MPKSLDCACVIHGDLYPWIYVERLHAMIVRNSPVPVNFHVFTEGSRAVPDHMIKHTLIEWPGVHGRKKAWWYKMQLFAPHIPGQILYFDLDTVITASLDWILPLNTDYFWSIRDFKSLWKPQWQGMNSSVMYWDNQKFRDIWKKFNHEGVSSAMTRYHGDQDFLTDAVQSDQRRFFDEDLVKSWRWQIKDGGMNPKTRQYHRPSAGSIMSPNAKILIFHGSPKPHEVSDPVIQHFWNPVLE